MEDKINIILDSWIGTKFKFFSSIKKTTNNLGGCDCFGFIYGFLKEYKNDDIFFKKIEILFYEYINRIIDTKNIKNHIRSLFEREIIFDRFKETINNNLDFNIQNILNTNQIVIMNSNERIPHLGIIYKKNNLYIIHSYIKTKLVCKTILDKEWIKKIDIIIKI